MKQFVFDIETDNVDPAKVTKIHCLSVNNGHVVKTTSDLNDMRKFWLSESVKVGHNIICYDARVLSRFLGPPNGCLVDTLPLAWACFPTRKESYGLEAFGEDFGIKKPEIVDWVNLTPAEYAHRCEEDTKINVALWKKISNFLHGLYDNDGDEVNRYIKYLCFKMECIATQEEVGWHIDQPALVNLRQKLEKISDEKLAELEQVMPEVPKYKTIKKPAKLYKQDGTLSALGAKWKRVAGDQADTVTEIKAVDCFVKPNGNSTVQIKDWLFDLGWQPRIIKDEKNKNTGEIRKVPQLKYPKNHEKEGELCESVLELAKKEQSILSLAGLAMVSHRIGFVNSMLDNAEDGKLKATVHGFTNTLRFCHSKPLANIPGVGAPYGHDIRSALVAPPDELVCGADMVSLESTTKRHYMFPYDPEYVAEMSQPGFDEHLDLAKHAGRITADQIEAYKKGDKTITPVRKQFKTTNYAAIYGIGPPKLAVDLGISKPEARQLLEAYWQRNWAVKALTAALQVKEFNGLMWLKNPVSGFWYYLKYEKDKFSTLNQGTGVYCFDRWIYELTVLNVKCIGQFHDEKISTVKEKDVDVRYNQLRQSIDTVNSNLQLNIKLDIGIKFGKTYADVH